MSKHFIPFDQAAAEAFAATIGKPFNTPEDFVSLFNSGLINKKAPRVLELVEKITTLYKDVKEVAGELVFVSAEEVYLAEISKNIELWTVVSSIKREVLSAVGEEKLSSEDVLLFNSSSVGQFLLENEQTGETVKISREKLFNNFSQIEAIAEKFSTMGIEKDEKGISYCRFAVSDFVKIDDSWVKTVHDSVPVI